MVIGSSVSARLLAGEALVEDQTVTGTSEGSVEKDGMYI